MSDEPNGFRIGIAGASGTLGREILSVLSDRRFPIADLKAFASGKSIGEEVEFASEVFTIEAAPNTLRGLDLLIVCTPAGAALDLVREALRSEVPCIDCSGAMANTPEVPLYVADLCAPSLVKGAPVVAQPAGIALAWSHLLAAVEGAAGLERVSGSILYSASRAGRAGIESLSGETLGLLNQQDMPPLSVFPGQVAFDCFALPAEATVEGSAQVEADLVRDIRRLVGEKLPISATAIQVPTFAGDGSAIAVTTKQSLSVEHALELFQKAPGLEAWNVDEVGPSTRDSAGRDVALVGRVRVDASVENGLLLWLAADTLRLAAVNAAKIAETRLAVG